MDKTTDISNTITDKILKYCNLIGLKVVVCDNQLLYLSHACVPLVGNDNKILYCNEISGNKEVIFPDANASLNGDQLTYTDLSGNLFTKTINSSTIVRQFSSQNDLNLVVKRMMDSYINYDAFYGVEFWDEPSYVHFDAIKNLMIAVHNAHETTYIQQCLLPSYANNKNLSGCSITVDYDTYIEGYASICNETKALNTIVTDYYPLNLSSQNKGSIYNGYIDGLRTVAYYSAKYDLNWKLVIQSFGQNKLRQSINDAKILWQSNIALSLGACSVDYYTYSRDTHGSYDTSIVDGTYTEGYTTTNLYNSIADNNLFLDSMNDLINAYKYCGSILSQTKDTYTNSQTHIGDTSKMSIISCSAETLLTKLVNGKYVYCLANIEKPCIMNESFFKDDEPINNQVSFKIDGATNATIYTYDVNASDKIKVETINATNNIFTYTLLPAQTIFLVLN